MGLEEVRNKGLLVFFVFWFFVFASFKSINTSNFKLWEEMTDKNKTMLMLVS